MPHSTVTGKDTQSLCALLEQCYNHPTEIIPRQRRLTLSRAHNLYQLQAVDNQIVEAKQYLRKIAANLGKTKAVTSAEQTAEAAQRALREVQSKFQAVELEVKGLVEKIAAQEKQLYSGKTMSAKEASNLQDEVTSLKKRHGQQEERLLELMVAVEEAETAATQAQETLVEAEEKWLSDQAKLEQLQTQFEEKLARLTEQRPTLVATIDQPDLADYDRLRTKKAGKAVAAVKQGVCQGCNVSVSNSLLQRGRSSDDLIYCNTCGKILYII